MLRTFTPSPTPLILKMSSLHCWATLQDKSWLYIFVYDVKPSPQGAACDDGICAMLFLCGY